MKKLIILVPSLEGGGQERVAVNTANILQENFIIKFIVFDLSDSKYIPNCKVEGLNVPSNSNFFYKIINIFKRAYRLKKIKSEFNCDIVYSFGKSANLVNCIANGAGQRFISIRGYKSTKLTFSERILYRKADMVLCVSNLIKDTLDKKYGFFKKTEVLYNPFNAEQLYIKSKEQVSDVVFNSKTIISHGRLNVVKNYPRLIKAFSLLNNVNKYQLLLIGQGEEETRLLKLIEKYNLQNNVHLLGYKENPFKYLARSSIYVLSSYNEGFPNSLVEAMHFLPVISVDCKSGPREILSSNIDYQIEDYKIVDYGLLVREATKLDYDEEINEDDIVLSKAISLYLDNPTLMDEMKVKANIRAMDFSYGSYKEKIGEFLLRRNN